MITLRVPLNRPLTFAEVDGNFTYLDSVKVENGASVGSAGQPVFVNKTGTTLSFRRLVAGANVTLALTSNGEIEISSAAGITDGDKGDITVSNSGSVWLVDNGAITNTKLATMPADTVKANITGTVGPAADVTKNDFRTWLGPGISQDPASPLPISLIWAGPLGQLPAANVRISTTVYFVV